MSKNRLIIIQPSIPHYRVIFFKTLAEMYGEKITILHFGSEVNIQHPLVDEIISSYTNIRGFKWVLSLNKMLKDYDTAVTVFDPHWLNLFVLPITQSKKKIILWGHGLGRNKLVNLIRIPLFKSADSIITYSENRKQRISAIGISNDKIFVANNTIEISNSIDTSGNIKQSFLYVGRLQRRKKLDVFLEIFAKNSLGTKGYKFYIIGDGDEERDFLAKYAIDLDIREYVCFVNGTTNNEILLEYFSEALYYVSPGAVGLGVLHSFAYGVPVLTMEDDNHGPEVDNIKQNFNGYVFKDKSDFNNNIIDFLDNRKYAQMGSNAYFFYTNERSINKMAMGFINALLKE